LLIGGGSLVTAESALIGWQPGSTGTVDVFGPRSTLELNGAVVGYRGTATLNVIDGGFVSSGSGQVGHWNDSIAKVLVSGSGSQWALTHNLEVGSRGNAWFRIEEGGAVHSGNAFVNAYGRATVTGSGSTWSMHDLTIATGTVNVLRQGIVQASGGLQITGYSDLPAILNVSGQGSSLTAAEQFRISGIGTAVNLTQGATLATAGSGFIGRTSTLSIDDAAWTHDGDFDLSAPYQLESGGFVELKGGAVATFAGEVKFDRRDGQTGIIQFDGGTLNTHVISSIDGLRGTGTVNTNGLVADFDLALDQGPDPSLSLLPITGENIVLNLDVAEANNPGTLGAGYAGSGSLTISNGRIASSFRGMIGEHAGSSGSALVTGAGSHWLIDGSSEEGEWPLIGGSLTVGYYGDGSLTISDGATVTSGRAWVGYGSTVVPGPEPDILSSGVVTVTGAGSRWDSSGEVHIGGASSAPLTITDGGIVSVKTLYGKSGPILVAGAGSQLITEDDLHIRDMGEGTFRVVNGGSVHTGDHALLAASYEQSATAQVIGTGSSWTINRYLEIGSGRDARGVLIVRDGAAVHSEYITLGDHQTSRGTIIIDGVGSSLSVDRTTYVGYFSGHGEITIRNGGSLSVGTPIEERGRVRVGDYSNGSGVITVTGQGSMLDVLGTLQLGDSGSATLNVLDGGRRGQHAHHRDQQRAGPLRRTADDVGQHRIVDDRRSRRQHGLAAKWSVAYLDRSCDLRFPG
jgi:T5SS/PEP-CTERM-associated repeat protein